MLNDLFEFSLKDEAWSYTYAAGCSGASSSTLKRPKVGQVRQMRGRFNIAKLPRPQSWTASFLALTAAGAAGAAGFSKAFSTRKDADSPKLIQTNLIPDIP